MGKKLLKNDTYTLKVSVCWSYPNVAALFQCTQYVQNTTHTQWDKKNETSKYASRSTAWLCCGVVIDKNTMKFVQDLNKYFLVSFFFSVEFSFNFACEFAWISFTENPPHGKPQKLCTFSLLLLYSNFLFFKICPPKVGKYFSVKERNPLTHSFTLYHMKQSIHSQFSFCSVGFFSAWLNWLFSSLC